ncbi:MAG TPA: AAA family ATPase [Candidatus Saccharimonadales bacterium]|nr:AAA family ATPase [Candidatus Saccharimonadales bacterium]
MDKKLQIIGLSGTNGAGKDTVGEVLAERHNYLFVSVTELLRDEVRRRGLPVEREHLRTVSAEWRREHGLGVLVDRAVQAWKETGATYQGVVVASLRNPYEADRIHELGGTMIWVDADPKVRYERITSGGRGRHEEDNKTFEQFLAEEAAEMTPPQGADAAVLNMAAVRDRADILMENNGADLDVFKGQIEETLGL